MNKHVPPRRDGDGAESVAAGRPAAGKDAHFRRRREAARRGEDVNDFEPKEARAGDPEREGARGEED